jgi:hypothetical protein
MQLSVAGTCRRIARIALAGWLALAAVALPAASTDAESTPGSLASNQQRQTLAPALEPGRVVQIRRIIADPDQACLAAGAAAGTAAAQIAIDRAVGAIEASPLGAWLLRQARARRVLICLDPTTGLAAYYRAEIRLIGIQTGLAAAAKAVFLAHELAHVLQHPGYSNNRSFPVHDLVLIHRMREATAEAIATRVLWQMRARGRSEPWEAKLKTGYRDIAHAFASTMAGATVGGDAAAQELRATRSAFERWFAWSERLRQYDDHLLDHVERIARDRRGVIPPQRALTDDFLRGITRYAGETFLDTDMERPLTGPHYRSGLSAENAARLARIEDASEPAGAEAGLALPKAGPDAAEQALEPAVLPD